MLLDTLSNERELKEEQALQRFSRLKEGRQMLTELIVENVISEVLYSELKTVVRNELRKAVCDHVDDAAHFIVGNLWRSKFVHIVDKETKAILKKTLKTDINEVTVGLRRFRERMELLWLRQFWDAWRSHVLENRRKRLERHRSWERFQGNWKCQMFLPSNYVIDSSKERTIKKSPLIDTREVRLTIRLAALKRTRRIAMIMLHRPRLSKPLPPPALPFQPSFATSRRKRKRSPSLGCLPGSFHPEFTSSPNKRNFETQRTMELSLFPSEIVPSIAVSSDNSSIDRGRISSENSLSSSVHKDPRNSSEGENLLSEAVSLHERMLKFSEDLNSLICGERKLIMNANELPFSFNRCPTLFQG
ncbi:hypothetical protein KIN20_007794 [Parelaphostrongylus tenuis]|uniref:Uncharacterized protein n=1 Tax=Parelaphostrongylus tenuis TaxID=148309 RepID=A0AAD5M5Y4_PARTN|nr:hypothetical protein KIN20_007794 [Parelaphostrongylus tenuis]